MSEHWATTQEHLIDHLLRILQGVGKTGPDENGIVIWDFGFGEDTLTTYQPLSPEDQKEWNEQGREWKKDAQLELEALLLAIEAGDHMGIPKRLAKLRREFRSKLPNIHETEKAVAVGKAWPKLDMLETKEAAYEIAYAYEALNKLKDMVDRGQQAVQEKHLLPKVPRWVDKYMSEAASCFRYGFDLACVALCRSALEEALKGRLKEECGPKAIEPGKGRGDLGLEELIDKAVRCSVLDLHFRQSAHDIRKAGNECVHGGLKGKQVRDAASEALVKSRLIIEGLYSN